MGKLAVVLDWPYGMIPWIWVGTLIQSDVIKEESFEVIRAQTTDITCSANMLIRSALERGATEILAVSADQSFPRDILQRLRAHNKDVVTALTATRQTGHHWLAFNLDKNGLGHRAKMQFPLEKVDVGAPGCMLIKSHVFNKIPPPWFKATVAKDGCGIVQTSDFYFFKKLKEYGFETYVDTTLESYHQTEVILNAETIGRKLPYVDIVANNDDIPVTSLDQDVRDVEDERYSQEPSTITSHMEGM